MLSTESVAVLTSMVTSLGTVLMMTMPNWSLIKSEASWGKEDEQRGELGVYTDEGDGLHGLQPGDQLLGLHLLDLLLKDPPAPVHGAGLDRMAVTTEKWTTIHSRLLLDTGKMTLSG